MFQESNDRLAAATQQLRHAKIKGEPLNRAERSVLSRFEPKPPLRLRGLFWTTAATAAAVASALLMIPTTSAAADLARILKNGDIGMRHLRAYKIEPDGSQQLDMEFYADGSRARMQSPTEQVFWEGGRCTIVHDDGATEVEKIKASLDLWFNYSAKQIIAVNASGKYLRVSVTHGVAFKGALADRYVLDVDTPVGEGHVDHRHSELLADPATERPLMMQTDVTGSPREIQTWDYPSSEPGIWKIPHIDKNRLYDVDAEQEVLRTAPQSHGPAVTTGGQRVELIQLWMDDRGNTGVVTQSAYPHAVNFSLRVDEKKLDPTPEDEETTRHYFVRQPLEMNERSMDLFYGEDSRAKPRPIPSTVSVSIPVVSNGKIAGYAEFHDVPVHRCWNVNFTLEGPTSPFMPHGAATAVQAAATDTHSAP